jgi:hypothetical protein
MKARELIECVRGMTDAELNELSQLLSPVLRQAGAVIRASGIEPMASGYLMHQQAMASMTPEQRADLERACYTSAAQLQPLSD